MAYRTLDCDEAEEKFAERGKILNMWASQLNKKLRPDQGGDDDDLDGEDGKKGKKGAKKADTSFKVHDGDDFGGSGDESFGDDSDEEDDKKKKKKNADSDDEGKIQL